MSLGDTLAQVYIEGKRKDYDVIRTARFFFFGAVYVVSFWFYSFIYFACMHSEAVIVLKWPPKFLDFILSHFVFWVTLN